MSAGDHKAVFLSYASQDAEAARRICEALRAAGLEVWFDVEGGLEHGDEWDAKIRRQIKECVLFLPIISANTQARHEGYFRIEWELAAERAMGIAAGVPFILPVVIDDTREPEALVPDRFRRVQWTRLPGGAVPEEVKQRFAKLWAQRTGAEAARVAPTSPSRAPGFVATRGLAAILFTDVVGYSARVQRDEKGTLALVEADFALMRERCAAHEGEVLNSMGDGLLLCFPSAVQAVSCALQIQSEFGRRREKLPPEQALEHRMGVHIGDVIRQDSGVAGDGVNIAARLEGKAPPGGVCISQIVHDTVHGKVPMQSVFLGPESFKNITNPIPVWHIAPEGSPSLSRPPMTSRGRAAVNWRRRAWWALAGLVAVAALGVGGVGVYRWYYKKQERAVLEALNMAPEPPIERNGRVLVAPLENRTGDPALDDLGQQVADHLRRRLPELEWVAQAKAARAADRLKLEALPTEMQALAKQSGADTLLSGYYRRSGDTLQFHGQVFDLKRETVFAELAPVDGMVAAPAAAIEEAAERMLGALVQLPRVRQGRRDASRFFNLAVPRRFDATQISDQGNSDDLGRYRRAYERDPKGGLGSLVSMSLGLIFREQYAEADAVLREIETQGLSRLSEYSREIARWMRATLDGDSAALTVTVDKLCQMSPTTRLWRNERGLGHYRANRPQALLAEFKAITPGSPGERVGTVWRARITAYFQLDDLVNMEASAHRLLKVEDESVTAYWALSYVALRRGDFATAMRVLDVYDGMRGRGDLVFNLYSASLAAMRASGKAQTPEFATLVRRADAWLASRPAAEAKTLETKFTRGEVAYLAGRYAEALKLAQELLRERPDDVRVQGFVGTAATRVGDRQLAEETIAKLRALDPRFRFGYPRFAEAKIAAVLGRNDEAMQLLREAFAQYTVMIKDFSWEGVRLSPDFESLRDDPRFQEFVRPKG